jgi:predicted Zn-dependent protease
MGMVVFAIAYLFASTMNTQQRQEITQGPARVFHRGGGVQHNKGRLLFVRHMCDLSAFGPTLGAAQSSGVETARG